MFKALIPAVLIATALAAPTFANAQDNAPISRAQVRAELVQLERAGYSPSADHATYPANLQAAQRRVDAQNGAAAAYGASTDGSSASGKPFARAAGAVNPVDYSRS
jgi:type II secretory pathway pseudopilin PulG